MGCCEDTRPRRRIASNCNGAALYDCRASWAPSGPWANALNRPGRHAELHGDLAHAQANRFVAELPGALAIFLPDATQNRKMRSDGSSSVATASGVRRCRRDLRSGMAVMVASMSVAPRLKAAFLDMERMWRAATEISGSVRTQYGANATSGSDAHSAEVAAPGTLPSARTRVPGPEGLTFINSDLAVLGVVAERGHAADPEVLALGGLLDRQIGGLLAL